MDGHPTKIDIGFDPSPYRNTASSTGNWNSNSHGIKKQRNTILIVRLSSRPKKWWVRSPLKFKDASLISEHHFSSNVPRMCFFWCSKSSQFLKTSSISSKSSQFFANLLLIWKPNRSSPCLISSSCTEKWSGLSLFSNWRNKKHSSYIILLVW